MQDSERRPPITEGEILAGKYRVERILGAGGMGIVVAAHHLQLDQRVALKFVHAAALGDAAANERFLREARLAVKLKSEHVAKVLDVGTLESGAPYIVMEYLDGSSFAEVLAAQGPMSVENAADCIVQACEALSEAHALGIVHRDLKPQNLFLTKGVGGAPLVKVLDFGISKMTQPGSVDLTQTATVMGSPLYMAPEQFRSSRNVDPRADIWALGVVMYELLTARVPFEGESMTDLAIKVAHDPFVPVDRLRTGVAPELSAVLSRCLEKEREHRFADAAALAAALERFASPAVRLSVHRAQMVSGAYRETLGAPSTTPPVPEAPGGRAPAATPAPWSGTGQGAQPPKPAAPFRVVAIGLLALVAGVAIAALAWTTVRGSGAAASSAPAPAAGIVTSANVASPVPTVAPVAAPTTTIAPAAAPTIDAVAPAPTASASAAPSARPASHAATAAPPRPAPKSTGSANRDDDIPSLR